MPNRNVITSGSFAPDQPTLNDPTAPVIEVFAAEERLTLNELTPNILRFEVIEQKGSSYNIHLLHVSPSARITAESVRECWAREHAVQKGYVVVLYVYARTPEHTETTAE